MSEPQAPTEIADATAGKRRLLQLLILLGAVASSFFVSLVTVLDPEIKIIVIASEAVAAIALYFVIGKFVK